MRRVASHGITVPGFLFSWPVCVFFVVAASALGSCGACWCCAMSVCRGCASRSGQAPHSFRPSVCPSAAWGPKICLPICGYRT